jgi:hypothetical protein
MEKKRKETHLCQMNGLKGPRRPLHRQCTVGPYLQYSKCCRRRIVALAIRQMPFRSRSSNISGNGGVAIGTTVDAKMPRGTEELGAAFREMA